VARKQALRRGRERRINFLVRDLLALYEYRWVTFDDMPLHGANNL
jgi:hypothetical protein